MHDPSSSMRWTRGRDARVGMGAGERDIWFFPQEGVC